MGVGGGSWGGELGGGELGGGELVGGERGGELCGSGGLSVPLLSCNVDKVAIGVAFAEGGIERSNLGLRGETRSLAAARFDVGPLRGWRPSSSSSLGLSWNCFV